jgi:hypothetical protein
MYPHVINCTLVISSWPPLTLGVQRSILYLSCTERRYCDTLLLNLTGSIKMVHEATVVKVGVLEYPWSYISANRFNAVATFLPRATKSRPRQIEENICFHKPSHRSLSHRPPFPSLELTFPLPFEKIGHGRECVCWERSFYNLIRGIWILPPIVSCSCVNFFAVVQV